MDALVPDPGGAILASTERYAEGWNVTIDGIREEVRRINFFFRGTIVPFGEHIIEWRYEPSYWLPLVILSYCIMFACGAAGIVMTGLAQKKRTRS